MSPLKIAIFGEVRKHHAKSESLTDGQLNTLMFRKVDGNRLAFPGFLILKNIFKVYSYEIPVTIKSRHYIGMEKIEWPYFVTSKRLILFSEMDAMVISLHGGIESFLEVCYNVGK